MDQAAVLLYDPQGVWTEGVKKLCAQRALRFRREACRRGPHAETPA